MMNSLRGGRASRKRYSSTITIEGNVGLAQDARKQLSSRNSRLQPLKMLCLTVLPILCLWCFSVYTLTDTINRKTENEKTKSQLRLNVELGKLIHQLQQERDMSVLYLSDLGPETKTFLLTEYISTDKAIDTLSEWPSDLDMRRSEFESRGKLQEFLSFHRQLLTQDTVNIYVEIDFYTKIIEVVIVWLYKSIMHGQFTVVWNTLIAYLKMTSGKQECGIERALGTLFFVQGGFESLEQFEMYNTRINRFKALYTTAELHSSRVDRLYTSGVKMVKTNITGIIHNFREEIQHHDIGITHPNMDKARYWFDNMTIYLDILLDIQQDLSYEIIAILDVDIDQTSNKLAISSVFLFVVLVMCPLVIYITQNFTSMIQRYGLMLLEQTRRLRQEKQKADGFQYQMVPTEIVNKIKNGEKIDPEYFQSVTILFLSMYGFNKILAECTPDEVVVLMNSVFGTIDTLLDGRSVFKVDTFKGNYMIASGLPIRNKDLHSTEVANLALEILDLIHSMRFSVSGNRYVQLLIGADTGSCTAYLVGAIKPRYCVFGESVNMAVKLKKNSSPNKIHISLALRNALQNGGMYNIKERRIISTQENAPMKTFWLCGKQNDSRKMHMNPIDEHWDLDSEFPQVQTQSMASLADTEEERSTSPDFYTFAQDDEAPQESVTAQVHATADD